MRADKMILALALGATLAVLSACNNQPAADTTEPAPSGSYAEDAQVTVCKFDPGTCALEAANHRMHKDMAVEWSGDPDVDFLKTMIPHHVGAVEMAEVVIKHGHDPKVRALAEEIVRTQEKEITQMRAMLADLDTNDNDAGSEASNTDAPAPAHNH